MAINQKEGRKEAYSLLCGGLNAFDRSALNSMLEFWEKEDREKKETVYPLQVMFEKRLHKKNYMHYSN